MKHNAENWKNIYGYEGLYKISDKGRVKSLKRTRIGKGGGIYPVDEKILKNRKTPNGYLQCCLLKNGLKKFISIHRLVATHFIYNPENKPQVNHKNGIKHDNNVGNLEWATQSENQKHAYKKGLQKHQFGEKRYCSKLTEKDVIEIKKKIKKGKKVKNISKEYGVHSVTITDIKMNRTWVRVNI